MLEMTADSPNAPSGDAINAPLDKRRESTYRPDIDGLRAVAVLSVVIYHLNKAWVPGGYVGVDIFFVISGFLITRNIWGEMADGRFSFANFYLRRIRRIAPAFLAMTAVTVLAGALLLLPEDLVALGKSAAWGIFSLSNVYFWRNLDTSYFAESSDEVPMLHTWSLGVEEQFYFIWPSLLLLALLFRRRRTAAIGIAGLICIASFACAELTNVSAQKFSYYMLPARAGELMVGALLALWTPAAARNLRGPIRASLAEGFAIAGAALVGWSLYGLNDASRFPGINAIYPCLGAALLMVAGGMESRIVKASLVLRPMVFIGLISYSLYLWHWPILAFIRYFYGGVDGVRAIGAVVAMLVLSVLSYRYVELPSRHWRASGRLQVLVLYVAPSLAVCFGAALIWKSDGFKSFIESSSSYRIGLARVERYTAPAYKFSYNCQLSAHDSRVLQAPRCIVPVVTGGQANEPNILLWGDSQAAHYIGVVGQIAQRQGFHFRNATHSSCPPVFGGDYGVVPYKSGCDSFRPYIQSAILGGAFRTVLISGAWNIYDTNPGFRQDLEGTIRSITAHGIHVVIIGQAPIFPSYNRECELRGFRLGGISCRNRLAMPDPGDSAVNRYLAGLASMEKDISYVDVREIICRQGVCNPYLDDRPVYFDGSHMSMDGSWLIGSKLAGADYSRWVSALQGDVALESRIASGALPAAGPVTGFIPRELPVILGGYRPGFPYHVRSQSHINSSEGHAGCVLEFWGIDQVGVIASVERDMARLGFKRIAKGASGSAIRLDFEKVGMPKVSVNVGPLGTLQPQAQNVAGIVYFRW